MAFPLPRSLSPSSLGNFTSCGLQFRFSAVERLPEAPSVPAMRGTVVHAALEHLFTLPPEDRRRTVGPTCVDVALDRLRDHREWLELALDEPAVASMRAEARVLVDRYFDLEDPAEVTPIGLELKMEADIGGVVVRGIIDRLDLVDGDLVVTDYKTGRAPTVGARQQMTGVHVYSLLCERTFGRRPTRVQLLHLAEPVAIVAESTAQSSTGLDRRLHAVWDAVTRACEQEDFRPRPSARCDWCSYRQWCPSFGGDPDRAAADLSVAAAAAEQERRGQLPLLSAG